MLKPATVSIKPEKGEEKLGSVATSPNKFQRTGKRLYTAPDETKETTEKTQSVLSQDRQNNDKIRLNSRITHPQQKEENSSSIIFQETVGRTNNRVRSQPNQFLSDIIPNAFKKITTRPQSQIVFNTVNTQKSSENSKITVNSPKNINVKTLQESKIQQQGFNVKKSATIILIFKRLLRTRMKSVINEFRGNKSKLLKFDIQAKILLLSMTEFGRRYEKQCYRQPFSRLKLILSKRTRQSFMIENQLSKIRATKIKQDIGNVLQCLYRQKMRSILVKLRKNRILKQNLEKIVPTLTNFYEKRKIKDAFNTLRLKSTINGIRKLNLLNQISLAFNFCNKQTTIQSFRKLVHYTNKTESTKVTEENQKTQAISRKNPISPKIVNKVSEVSNENTANQIQKLNQQIKSLQQNIQKKKRNQQNDKNKSKTKVLELQKTKTLIEGQIVQKQRFNSERQEQIQNLMKDITSHTEDISQRDSTLSLLQRLYSQITKIPDEDISIYLKSLLKQLKIDEKNIEIVKEWAYLKQKITLQSQINNYQADILGIKDRNSGQTSIYKIINEQNEMTTNMIRNYVKQRYLWSQVQRFVSQVI